MASGSLMYHAITGAGAAVGRWQICDLCIQTLAATYCGPLDPGLTIKRALNAGYQGLRTIH